MAGESIQGIDYGTWKTVLLVVFFGVFAAILVALLRSRSSRYDGAARLPLEDGASGTGSAGGGRTRDGDERS